MGFFCFWRLGVENGGRKGEEFCGAGDLGEDLGSAFVGNFFEQRSFLGTVVKGTMGAWSRGWDPSHQIWIHFSQKIPP
ncbi:hypothetical protein SLEP1_g36186 [Rubroshorea leprosula]|uniref:Uncharacterized protein n=1 Tax=Rubroshorea leprosula TaxID=152421 RepID=A0AAV5KR74_9ROSI|nr:hypothetical protein SLEP1_g36186 [Rubroshorea leprosula]